MRCFATRLFFLLLAANTVPAAANELSAEQIMAGWISLFDGDTLFGWEATSDADWRVERRTIYVAQGKPGWLMTTTQFADYELHVEFKAPATTNSGIFLRTPRQPTDPAKDCYELNIAPPNNLFPTGRFVNRKGTLTPPGGTVEGETQRGAPRPNPWDGQWHAYDVVVRGTNASVQLDDLRIAEVEGSIPNQGHIGLQFRKGEIAFRNIRLKPLGTRPIFNGKNLAGWNINRAEASRFEVTPKGELRVLDGRGQIETDASYGDFVLQTDCFVDGDALNSGLFFRCIPRDFMMGYECQIHNGVVDGDPTKPQDCGTGGFFRRQNARRVVSRDREWFAMTLVVDGPHMAAWVNGTQVSGWTDTRAPDENPRKGLRLEPGTIAIQGHDPTTDLRFRNLRVVELPVRE